MKAKHLLTCSVMLLFTVTATIAQNATNKHLSAKDDISFGKKLTAPDFSRYPGIAFPETLAKIKAPLQGSKHAGINTTRKNFKYYREQIQINRNVETRAFQSNTPKIMETYESRNNSDFHLTRDINALAESNPANNSDVYGNTPYAVLRQVAYFAADDGVHGNELWRSDGTAEGTFMLMDIEPGEASSNPSNIAAANGKVYFSASTLTYGAEPWVSDGTKNGTQLLLDINPGAGGSGPTQFVELGKKVFFAANDVDLLDALWESDGTVGGTKLVKGLGINPGGYAITQLVKANGLLFFTFISYSTFSWELWRSDGTDAGTFHIGTNVMFYDVPLQLTKYNDKLYFSSDDGTGRKLWVTDGTDAGTTPAPGNNDKLIGYDNFGTSFPVLNNILYIPGTYPNIGGESALYKYNASNAEGVTVVKYLAQGITTAFITPSEMEVVNNTLYFKVTNYNDGVHDELWSTNGSKASTRLVYKFLPGEIISNLYKGNGTFYFVKRDKIYGTELWRTLETPPGTFPKLVSDIFRGATSSYPTNLTAFKEKLIFAAVDGQKGNELFITNGFSVGTTLVKDINTVSTSSSQAGYYINTITPLEQNVIFRAFERVHGNELYKSDGTREGTFLLNDIVPGEVSSYGYNFITKNNAAWFIAQSTDSTYSIFKTNGTKQGLQKVTPDYLFGYSIQDLKVANNGTVFYVVLNYYTYSFELWRSDGTIPGTILLSSALYNYNYLNVAGNTAFFTAGDAEHGYELWKSNGTVAGTGIVMDINPGPGNSAPAGMFIYKNEVYFGAFDGVNASFWKSNGTASGTIRLQNIDPWYDSNVFGTQRYRYSISNGILYFSAIDYTNSLGTQIWKTDGTPSGTQTVTDINPIANSYYPVPFYFTDVNGIVFFIGDDGVNGTELWKTDGTAEGTKLVKDITPGIDPSNINNLVSFAGKLFFTNNGVLWSSDGTVAGTVPVNDEVISEVVISNIVTTPDKMFLSGYTYKYGIELYAGKVSDNTGLFTVAKIANEKEKTAIPFNAMVYPNPSVSNVTLQVTGAEKNISISITDISGKKIWHSEKRNAMLIALPTEKFAPGVYIVTVTNGIESKAIKFVKK